MSTLRQIEANRRNARKSTGPASVTGKAVSSMNALKTGIHAKSLILPTEKLADLEELIEEYCRHHQPVSPEARLLVDDLITAGSRHGAVPRKRVCDLELIALPALHFGVGHRTRLHSKEPFRPLRSADLHRPPTGLNRGSPSCCCGIAAVQYRYAPLVPAPALSTGCGKTARPGGAGRNGAVHCRRPRAPPAHSGRRWYVESAVGAPRPWETRWRASDLLLRRTGRHILHMHICQEREGESQ